MTNLEAARQRLKAQDLRVKTSAFEFPKVVVEPPAVFARRVPVGHIELQANGAPVVVQRASQELQPKVPSTSTLRTSFA